MLSNRIEYAELGVDIAASFPFEVGLNTTHVMKEGRFFTQYQLISAKKAPLFHAPNRPAIS
jgi:hypothetical protein